MNSMSPNQSRTDSTAEFVDAVTQQCRKSGLR
jgi:hypothetical protein